MQLSIGSLRATVGAFYTSYDRPIWAALAVLSIAIGAWVLWPKHTAPAPAPHHVVALAPAPAPLAKPKVQRPHHKKACR